MSVKKGRPLLGRPRTILMCGTLATCVVFSPGIGRLSAIVALLTLGLCASAGYRNSERGVVVRVGAIIATPLSWIAVLNLPWWTQNDIKLVLLAVVLFVVLLLVGVIPTIKLGYDYGRKAAQRDDATEGLDGEQGE